MSREKQIEEMVGELRDVWIVDWEGNPHNLSEKLWDDELENIAIELYNIGYRKQSEGEWQTAPDKTHWCSECGHDATYTFDGTEICGVACPFCGAKMKGGAE